MDRFVVHPPALDSPASSAFAISLDVEFPIATRSIYVGGQGNVAVVPLEGSPVVFVAVPAGSMLPIRASRVNSAGTTATNLVGMF